MWLITLPLLELGKEIGLDETDIQSMLQSDQFGEDVQRDTYEVQQVGARDVPFFVFNRR
jgi:predicted DsbA family dithiol-disulfide isomerase